MDDNLKLLQQVQQVKELQLNNNRDKKILDNNEENNESNNNMNEIDNNNTNKKRKYNKKTITTKEFNVRCDYIHTELSKMIDKFYKQINEEYMPQGYDIPNKENINELLQDIKSLKNEFKLYINENKTNNKTIKTNYGLKIPQYLNINMTNFVNLYSDLPQDINVYINKKINLGVFARISLTKFWVYYIEKNKLKDKNNKSIIMIDDNMRKLFNNIYKIDDDGNNITYLDFFKTRIDEINNNNIDKKNNNCSRYILDDNGLVTGFNFAALQVIIAYYFINGYIIPNNHKYIDRLDKTNQFFSNKTEKLKLNNKSYYTKPINKKSNINNINTNNIINTINNNYDSSKINIKLSGLKQNNHNS